MSSVKSSLSLRVSSDFSGEDQFLLKQFSNRLYNSNPLKILTIDTHPNGLNFLLDRKPVRQDRNKLYYPSGTRITVATFDNSIGREFQGWSEKRGRVNRFSTGDNGLFWTESFQEWSGLLDTRSNVSFSFNLDGNFDLIATFWSGDTHLSNFEVYSGDGRYLEFSTFNHFYDTGFLDFVGLNTGEFRQIITANFQYPENGISGWARSFYPVSDVRISNTYNANSNQDFVNFDTGISYELSVTGDDTINIKPLNVTYDSGIFDVSGILWNHSGAV